MGAQGRVAAIEPHARRRKHVRVIIEGCDDLTLHEDVAVALGLHAGALIDEERLRAVAHEQQVHKALQGALGLLKHRSRSREELVRSLERKGFDDAIVGAVLVKLENLGLVNDAMFARDLARGLLRRHVGRQGLTYRLRHSGVEDEVAQEAVAELLEDVDETERAGAALEKHLRKWRDLSAMQRRQKAYQLLARLGFDAETISDVLNNALTDETHAPEE